MRYNPLFSRVHGFRYRCPVLAPGVQSRKRAAAESPRFSNPADRGASLGQEQRAAIWPPVLRRTSEPRPVMRQWIRDQSLMRMTPITMRPIEIHRQIPTGSRIRNAAMTVAKRMLVSRSAATSAIGAIVNAQTAIQ